MPSKARISGNLVSDNNLFVNPTTDNTGIGTTNPTSKLHVIGNGLFTGIVTASNFVGTLSGTATTSINVIGGIGSITQLQVTGISTFTNGPVLIGVATSTGTASQPLQVTGNAYVSGNLGIGTTNPTSKLQVIGDASFSGISTFQNVSIAKSISDSNNSFGINQYVLSSTPSGILWQPVTGVGGITGINVTPTVENNLYYLPFISVSLGTTAVNYVTSGLRYNPSTNTIGIGTTNPTSALTVSGDGLFTGIVTASNFVGSGTSLTDVRIGIRSDGNNIGFAGTINFAGPGFSTITVSSGIATVNIPATVRNTSYTIAYEGQTIFPATYTIGFVEVFFNGSKLSPTQYSANDGSNIILTDAASSNDIIETIGYNGILKLYASKTILTDVSSDGLTFYTGKAAVGIATTQASWTIRRSLFSTAGIVTSTGIARNIAWLNRSTGIYT